MTFTCLGCGNRIPDTEEDAGCLACDLCATCTPNAGNCLDCAQMRAEDQADWMTRYTLETPEVPC
jgi:hypothetical protein